MAVYIAVPLNVEYDINEFTEVINKTIVVNENVLKRVVIGID